MLRTWQIPETWIPDVPTIAPGGRGSLAWQVPPTFFVPDGVQCPSLSSPARDCVGTTKTVDLRQAAKSVQVLVTRVAFAGGTGVWIGPPEFDIYEGPPPWWYGPWP